MRRKREKESCALIAETADDGPIMGMPQGGEGKREKKDGLLASVEKKKRGWLIDEGQTGWESWRSGWG